jgi:hypothetical protein
MVTLLAFAVRFYQDNESTQTLDVVALLREAIAKLRQASGSSRFELSNGEVYDVRVGDGAAGRATLDRFADAIERELESRWELVVSRHRSGNPRLRAFLVRLAAATQALFDRSFAGCVATIASVLFDQQVPRSRVWSCAVQAVTNRRALDASHTKELDARRAAVADRYALNVLPVVREMQDAGTRTLRGIADELNRRSVPTPRGRKWYASSVRNLLARAKWVIP